MSPYKADPGGWLDSDYHRRVLGHLSPPHEPYGWTVEGLFGRMAPDTGTSLGDHSELISILESLEADGFAQRVSQDGMELWAQTQKGFDLLTGGIKDEPQPGEPVRGPAVIATSGAIPFTRPVGE